ncbi:hypothetical protein KFL_002370090 [Klebsormidium nitens]|uniref:Uncharacterized protein n=1 Tax=Klebsormidium nitens TaxID=105231 RepID=A0A1Y1I3G2_KLENI|nr:hypothetical protein KFL_002370090 [Klebsormidium nitens]|eukprot:GAQ85475.1 hypothetical protein KFL_002370090 [Klebsormidium nitens]
MPGKGLYANLMNNDDNVDFHLLLDKVARVNLVTAKSKRGDFQTHTIRFYDTESFNGASIFVMWKSGTMGEYAEGQVEAFESLVKKYGEEITFD